MSRLLSTLIAFICVYALFLTAFPAYVARVIRRGPQQISQRPGPRGYLKPALTGPVVQAVPAE